MANYITNISQNFLAQDDFFDASEVNILSETPTNLSLLTPDNTLQQYSGFGFMFDVDGNFTGGTLTGITELTANVSSTLTSLLGISVPISVLNSFADRNDSFGFQAYVLVGNDSITGSAEADTLLGYSGNDIIVGNSGNDLLNGNQGADNVSGGDGNDNVSGGKDVDTVYGGQGDDIVNGNIGNDLVYGETGNDTARGGQNNDTIYGGDGNDIIFGDRGNDLLNGNAGVDTFAFGNDSGQDTIADYDSTDRIQIQNQINGFNISNFADIQSRITIIGNSSQIDLGNGNNITISGVVNLDSSDFLFI